MIKWPLIQPVSPCMKYVLPLTLLLAPMTGVAETDCATKFKPASGSYEFAASSLSHLPPDHRSPATIDDVHITRLAVFDESNPKENNAIYRFGNRMHILTRDHVVRRDLLFASGDRYAPSIIEESARLLRNRDHLYDADIRVISHCDDEVDLEVITRDVWSFTPEVSFDRSGGENSYRFGIAETNLLGRGKELSFVADHDIDRTSSRLVYDDVNIGGSRTNLRLDYTDSDDGFQQFVRLEQPFYSLDTERAWLISYDRLEEDAAQYFLGEKVTEVRRDIHEAIISTGFSRGRVNGLARRWRLGWTWRDDRVLTSETLPPPTPFPADRLLSYPWLSYAVIEDNYTTVFNRDEIYRTEDLHLGYALNARVGFAFESLGSDQDRIVLQLGFRDTILFDGKHLMQHRLSLEGFYNQDVRATEDLTLGYQLRYFRSRSPKRAFFAVFDGLYTRNLNTYRQIVLGGITGARAFDNRFQVGDRRLHLTLEERQYTDWHPFNLIRIGFAAFIDVGRAWTPGRDDGLDDKLLANIGIGMRIASSKANVGRMIHIDVSYPLTNRDHPLVDSVQLSVNIKDTF